MVLDTMEIRSKIESCLWIYIRPSESINQPVHLFPLMWIQIPSLQRPSISISWSVLNQIHSMYIWLRIKYRTTYEDVSLCPGRRAWCCTERAISMISHNCPWLKSWACGCGWDQLWCALNHQNALLYYIKSQCSAGHSIPFHCYFNMSIIMLFLHRFLPSVTKLLTESYSILL